jgi:DNA-binding transcriptional LysR family regulator
MFAIHAMNLSAIDLNLLVALDALLSEGHVGRAARKVGLSQPAASHALNRLRSMFSDTLLVRCGSRMELTPRAIELRESVSETLQRVQMLLVTEPFNPAKSTRQFNLMIQDHVAHLLVPSLVDRVQAEAPGVLLNVLPWQTPATVRPEKLRSIDLLISCSTSDIAGFQKQPLFLDSEVTVVRKGCPSAQRMRNLKAFLNAKHVAVVSRGLAEDPVDTWFREERVTRRIALRVPSYLQALQVVARTDLLAVVPKRLADSMAMPLCLRLLPVPIDPGEYREHIFIQKRAAREPASIWLTTLLLNIGTTLYGSTGSTHWRLALKSRPRRC